MDSVDRENARTPNDMLHAPIRHGEVTISRCQISKGKWWWCLIDGPWRRDAMPVSHGEAPTASEAESLAREAAASRFPGRSIEKETTYAASNLRQSLLWTEKVVAHKGTPAALLERLFRVGKRYGLSEDERAALHDLLIDQGAEDLAALLRVRDVYYLTDRLPEVERACRNRGILRWEDVPGHQDGAALEKRLAEIQLEDVPVMTPDYPDGVEMASLTRTLFRRLALKGISVGRRRGSLTSTVGIKIPIRGDVSQFEAEAMIDRVEQILRRAFPDVNACTLDLREAFFVEWKH